MKIQVRIGAEGTGVSIERYLSFGLARRLDSQVCNLQRRKPQPLEIQVNNIPSAAALNGRFRARGLQRLARAMMQLAENMEGDKWQRSGSGDRHRQAEIVRAVIFERQRRDAFFKEGLFGEPAWDILLDLFVASHEGEERSTKQVCLASGVPEATALRYLAKLVRAGFIERRPDSDDQRRRYLKLTDAARETMSAYFDAMPFIGDDCEALRELTQLE